jgi:hypothetical protein
VSKVSVAATAPGGQILIAYGGTQANAKLPATAILSLSPGLDANYDVIWVCGTAPVPATIITAGPATATANLPAAYLPTSCHS